MFCSTPAKSVATLPPIWATAPKVRTSPFLSSPSFVHFQIFQLTLTGLAGRSDKFTQSNRQSRERVILIVNTEFETTCKGIYSQVRRCSKQIIYIKRRTNDSTSVGCPSSFRHEKLQKGIVYIGKCSACVDQSVLRLWLFEIVNPCSKVGIGVSCQVAMGKMELA